MSLIDIKKELQRSLCVIKLISMKGEGDRGRGLNEGQRRGRVLP